MVDIASRANRSVTLPSLKQTRGHIIKMFKEQMFLLKERLNVSVFFSSLLSALTTSY
jgi:hypothetical protein